MNFQKRSVLLCLILAGSMNTAMATEAHETCLKAFRKANAKDIVIGIGGIPFVLAPTLMAAYTVPFRLRSMSDLKAVAILKNSNTQSPLKMAWAHRQFGRFYRSLTKRNPESRLAQFELLDLVDRLNREGVRLGVCSSLAWEGFQGEPSLRNFLRSKDIVNGPDRFNEFLRDRQANQLRIAEAASIRAAGTLSHEVVPRAATNINEAPLLVDELLIDELDSELGHNISDLRSNETDTL